MSKRKLFKAHGNEDGGLVIELYKSDVDKIRAVEELVTVLPTCSTVEKQRAALAVALKDFLNEVAPPEDMPKDFLNEVAPPEDMPKVF